MASITLKEIPESLHAQLKAEAEANYRSLTQEVMVRIERSFAVQDSLSTATVNRLIDEAIASGAEVAHTREQLRAKFDQVREHTGKRLAAKKNAV